MSEKGREREKKESPMDNVQIAIASPFLLSLGILGPRTHVTGMIL